MNAELENAGSSAQATAPLRILVVDDNADTATMLARLLGSWGHDAHAAFDAKQALELARQFLPEMAIVDLSMPIMDGYQLANELRQLATPQPIMLVAHTGPDILERRQRAIEAGIGHYLVKPAGHDALRDVIALAGRQRKGTS